MTDIFYRWFTHGTEQDIKMLHLSILSFKKFNKLPGKIIVYFNGKYNFEDFITNFKKQCNNLNNMDINFVDQNKTEKYFEFSTYGVWWKWVPVFSENFGDIQVSMDNDLIFIKDIKFLYNWIDSESDFLAIADRYMNRTTSCGSLGVSLRHIKHKLINSGFVGIKKRCQKLLENTLKRVAKEQYKQGNIKIPIDEQGAINFSLMILGNNDYIKVSVLSKEEHESFWPPENLGQVELLHFLGEAKTILVENYDYLKDIIINTNIEEAEQQLIYRLVRKV